MKVLDQINQFAVPALAKSAISCVSLMAVADLSIEPSLFLRRLDVWQYCRILSFVCLQLSEERLRILTWMTCFFRSYFSDQLEFPLLLLRLVRLSNVVSSLTIMKAMPLLGPLRPLGSLGTLTFRKGMMYIFCLASSVLIEDVVKFWYDLGEVFWTFVCKNEFFKLFVWKCCIMTNFEILHCHVNWLKKILEM